MDATTEKRLVDLERRLEAAERRLTTFSNMQIAPESGGGRIVLGTDQVMLVINALTPSSARVP